jgi:histidine ammonia-lyase
MLKKILKKQDQKENKLEIQLQSLNYRVLKQIFNNYFQFYKIPKLKIKISTKEKQNIINSYNKVQKVLNEDKKVYGINTGFGKLYDKIIDKRDLNELQNNLIYSHFSGYGPEIDDIFSSTTVLIRLKQLALGYSGVSLELIEYIKEFIEKGYISFIPVYGSVGGSGDLIPLASIAASFIKANKIKNLKNYKDFKLYEFKPKEALAFINGVAFSLSLFSFGIFLLEKLINYSNLVFTISLIANNVNYDHFNLNISKTRKNSFFLHILKDINKLLKDFLSELYKDYYLQAPYSYRCYPQILESFLLVLDISKKIIDNELNTVSDNPLVIGDNFYSAGNFHGNTISTFTDHLKLHIFQLSNISYERQNHLLNPDFLTTKPGLSSGFMISHYLTSHLLAELKIYTNYVSVNNYPVSLNQEDFITHSELSTKNLLKSIKLAFKILTLELIMAIQKVKLKNININENNLKNELLKYFEAKVLNELNNFPIKDDSELHKKYTNLYNLHSVFIDNLKFTKFKI